ncbi:hypothetical protein JHK85_042445 [Glycine max]|uniref:Uncharacterized protein n=1 Tax=Glycine soja TaxID=3848 RepID=A0A445GR72_GLYSO|nr:hypothetical protein JHK87_041738 [Glycine soja]KAG4956065.1 hypothetical protein JHK85_042445 [Glycine max]RZB63744.1 hypothetical protein D0Y65_040370 [Glycine soja]
MHGFFKSSNMQIPNSLPLSGLEGGVLIGCIYMLPNAYVFSLTFITIAADSPNHIHSYKLITRTKF